MPQKFYKYGNDKLHMKVLKNLHEVIDFVNPNNENLKAKYNSTKDYFKFKKRYFISWSKGRFK